MRKLISRAIPVCIILLLILSIGACAAPKEKYATLQGKLVAIEAGGSYTRVYLDYIPSTLQPILIDNERLDYLLEGISIGEIIKLGLKYRGTDSWLAEEGDNSWLVRSVDTDRWSRGYMGD